MTTSYRTFADVVFARAAASPNDTAYRFHSSGRSETIDLRMDELASLVRAMAAALQRRGLQGERVVLALPHSPDFVLAFFACLAAGAVAVPVPQQRDRKADARFDAVLANAAPALVIVDAAALAWVRERSDALAAGTERRPASVVTTRDLSEDPAGYRGPATGPETLAVLQYTSGSTGEPKGVMISHGNLLSNCALIEETLQIESTSAGVLWLPFYHDMGLVGAVLLPMYSRGCVDLMSPQDFLRAPLSWLEKLSKVRATTTAAPNFALELCCDFASRDTVAGLDLSALRCLLTGSEPVNAATIERFAATFAPCGFRADAILPAYGLAEATLLATGTLRSGTGPTIRAFDARALAAGKVEPARMDHPAARFVGNGAPSGRARIADPETHRPLAESEIGEIWLTGPGIAGGYWGLPERSAEVFGARLAGEPDAGPFYRTGDLGFVRDDDLFIAGRLKDLIIVRGRNIYPQDVEEAATRGLDLLWTGAAAAFATDRGHGEEVVLVVEADPAGVSTLRAGDAVSALVADMLARIAESHEIVPAEICIVRPGRLPRTSSGKIRRRATQDEWKRSGFAAPLIHRWSRPDARSLVAPAPPSVSAAPLTRGEVEAWLLARLAHHSGQPPHLIDLDEPFASYGLDSVTAVELIEAVNRLNIGGRTVDPVDLYDHPTIARLLDHMFGAPSTGKPPARPDHADQDPDLAREAAALMALLDD